MQPLVVGLEPFYVLTTPFIPGVEPGVPVYSISTPVIPGLELPLDAGPDDLDETYLRTTLSGPDYGPFHADELYEATTFSVNYTTPISFYPINDSEVTVQALAVSLDPGEDQIVNLTAVRL